MDFDEYARVKTFNDVVSDGWWDAAAELLRASASVPQDVRLLDYGCGDGKYYRHLVNHGLAAENVHGVDVSAVRVERCRAIGWEQARCIPETGQLPYPDAHFDFVNMMEVVEHIPATHIDCVLDEICRVLRPTGVLLGSTPNYPIKRFYDTYDAIVFRKWIRLRDDPTHVTLYNHRRLQAVLDRHFQSVDLRTFKSGFLYRRVARAPFFRHKMLFVCRRPVSPSHTEGGS